MGTRIGSQGLAGFPSYGRTRGHGVSRPLNNFESNRFSFEPVLGESASGYNTPDNASVMSMYPPISSVSPYNDLQDARAGGRIDLERSSTSHPSSELSRSSFVPAESGMQRVSRPPIWHGSYMASGSMNGGDNRPPVSGFPPGRNRRTSHSLDHQSGAEVQYMMNQQRLMDRGLVGGGGEGGASKRDSSTDDEMSDGKVPKYRRTSLPERSVYALNQRQSRRPPRVDAGGMWDFKTRGHVYKSHIPIGRVSPITPTETERVAIASLYSSRQLMKDNNIKVSLAWD